MANVEIIKKQEGYINKEGKIENRKTRVAAYARVSTDSDEQQTSFISQQKYYLDKITKNSDWNFVEVYADEGISGTQVCKRENFMRMIKDAMDGKIDLILTKSISRFARNTLDTLRYVRELRNANVGIIFEEENINTMDMAGELMLTILSSVAQQESENISSHVKLGLRIKKERGELIGNAACYGYSYDHETKKMLIIEEEAKIVRRIFQLYLQGYGSSSISKILTDMNIASPTGKPSWRDTTIANMLKNEKYVGDVILGKTYTTDPITHKIKKNNGEEDKYLVRNHHDPIISREEFEKVQEIFNSRNSTKPTGRKVMNRYTFSGRFRCGFCGRTFVKKSLYKKRPAWDCISVVKYTREICKNSRLTHEDVIKSCFSEAFNLLTADEGVELDKFLLHIKEVISDSTPQKMIKKLETAISDERRKINKLIDLLVEEKIDNKTFELKQSKLQKLIEEKEAKIEAIKKDEDFNEKVSTGIENMKKDVLNFAKDNSINKIFNEEIFDSVVDYGIIGAINELGQPDPYVIRFIIKNNFKKNSMDDITEEKIVENNKIGQDNSIYIPVLDFISSQHFFAFERTDKGMRKKLITKVRVRVEVER